jgi:hypothetical protein
VLDTGCNNAFNIVGTGGLSDVRTVLIQRLQDMDSVVQAEFKSVTDQIRVYGCLLISMTLFGEHRQQPDRLPELVMCVSQLPK